MFEGVGKVDLDGMIALEARDSDVDVGRELRPSATPLFVTLPCVATR